MARCTNGGHAAFPTGYTTAPYFNSNFIFRTQRTNWLSSHSSRVLLLLFSNLIAVFATSIADEGLVIGPLATTRPPSSEAATSSSLGPTAPPFSPQGLYPVGRLLSRARGLRGGTAGLTGRTRPLAPLPLAAVAGRISGLILHD